MKFRRIIPAIATLFASLIPLGSTASFAQDPPSRVARIAFLQGNVSLQPAGVNSWSEVPANYPMYSGDRIYADQGARAIVQAGSADVRLWGGTDVTLTNLTDNYEQIGLAQGFVRVRIFTLNPGDVVEVDTPNAAVIIQQPGDYRIDAYNDQASLVSVNAGSVQITGPGLNQEVDQGQAVQISGANPVELGLVEMPGFDDLDRWSLDRDRHILASVSVRYVNRSVPGYDDLDDYGDWSATPDYGPVWYPRSVAVGWQPYTVGRWVYVAPWGYTWVDEAPWGYAPFHYGRWAVIGGRWGWVPGPPAVVPIYSPALVAFVGSPGGIAVGIAAGVAAWFPLGVAEPYVPWYHCSPTYVRQVNVTNVNVTVIRNTTIINNYNTFITNTRTVTNVNQINVTNVNYVNREHVVAVPGNAFSSGARVQQAAVHLNQQQLQQISKAPIVVARPPSPPPAKPVLQARTNVARPPARPVLMSPTGTKQAATASAKPMVRPAALPKPAPPTAIKPATKPIAPNLKPAAPTNPVSAGSHGTPTAPGAKPQMPAVKPAPVEPARTASPGNTAKPTSTAKPTTPGQTKPSSFGEAQQPAPAAKPTPVAKPAVPAKPTTQPARPEAQPHPTPVAKPAPETRPAPAKPAPQAHPTPPPAHPQPTQAHPAAQPQAHPQQKTPPKEQKPEEKKPEEQKPE
jgi:hypothetical protein